MSAALRDMLPKDKHDVAAAQSIVALGYPAVAPILGELLAWVQDMNWPVARVLQPFLSSIGEPLAPMIGNILRADDNTWKYWLVASVVAGSPALVHAMRPDLVRIAETPTDGEVAEEVNVAAQEVLRGG
jgi:hypothetical protein